MSDQSLDDGQPSNDGLFPIPIGSNGLRYLFYGGLLVYVVYHLSLTPSWSWENKLFPYLVGFPLIVLLVLNLVLTRLPQIRERFAPSSTSEGLMSEALSTEDDPEKTPAERQKSEFGIIAWTVALPVVVYLLGFAYSLPTFILAFTYYYTRDLKTSLTATGLFTAFAYVVFLVLLNLRMYHGVVGLPNILEYIPT